MCKKIFIISLASAIILGGSAMICGGSFVFSQDQPVVDPPSTLAESQPLSFSEIPTNYNLLKNSSFESFSEGEDLAPDSWQRSGIKVSLNKSTRRFGDYSVRLYKGTGKLSQELKDITYFKEEQRPLSFGCWVYTSVPSQVRLSLEDGVNTTYSNYHTGSGKFEFLSLTYTLNPSSSQLTVSINLEKKGEVFVDGACLYELISEPVFIPSLQDELKMPSNLIYTDLENQKVGIGVIPDTEEDHRLEVDGNIKASGSVLSGDNELLTQISADGLYINDQPLTGQELLTGSLNITGNLIVDTYLQTNGNIQAEKFLFSDGTELKSGLWSKKEATEDIYYTGGNVGIGTTNPSQKFQVVGNVIIGATPASVRANLEVLGTTLPGSDLAVLNLRDSSSPTKKLKLGYLSTENVGYIQPIEEGVANRNLALVPDAGNVGIGTTEPSNKLSVVNDIGILTNSPAEAGAAYLNFYNQANRGLSSQIISESTGTGGLSFWTERGNIRVMTLTSAGNVGIGTTSPAANLEIAEPGSLRLANGRQIEWGGSNTLVYGYDDGSLYLHSDKMVVTNSGNVGIGITEPTQQFALGGTVGNFGMSTADASDNANLQISGGGGAGTTRGSYINLYGNEHASAGKMQFFTGIGGGSGNNFEFYTDQSGGATAKMVILSGGNVGIGTTNPLYKLDVQGGAINASDGVYSNGVALISDGNINWDNDYGFISSESDPTVTASVKDGVSWSEISNIPSGFSDNIDDVGITSESDPRLPSPGSAGKILKSNDGTNWISWTPDYITANSTLTGLVQSTVSGTSYFSGGNVGIGKTTPTEKLDVAGTVKATAFDLNGTKITSWPSGGGGISGSGTANKIPKWTGSTSVGDSIITQDGSNNISLNGQSIYNVGYYQGNSTFNIYPASATTNPGFVVYTGTGSTWSERMRITGNATTATISFTNAYVGIGTTSVDSNYKITTSGGGIKAESNITGQPAGYFSNPSGYALVTGSGNVGIGTNYPQTTLDVNGTTRTKVLTITGGADIAEPFKVQTDEIIQPGMVLAINPQDPGSLKLVDKAYDKTVAGIVSGAKGINPGLTLQQEESMADGAVLVAMSGRVYCLADNSNGEIKPGDLLTTSNKPGYAMKATDSQKAQGAIIGKAMSELNEGDGLVLVLVSLQ